MADPELLGHLGQRVGVDDGLAQVGQLALVEAVLLAVGEVGHDPAEDGVAQELQPFVGGLPGDLRAPRAMGEGLAQQGHVTEDVAEPPAQLMDLLVRVSSP